MKQFIYFTIIFFLVISNRSLFSQKKFGIDDPNARYGGLALVQSNNGGGIGGFYEKALNSSNHLTANLNYIFVRGDNDYPLYDPYTSYYYNTSYYYERVDKTRLNFLSFQLGYKRILFVNQLANNFRPFLYANAGPVLAIDPPNISDWSERMKNISYYYAGTVNFGAGVDFATTPKALISLFVGYEYLHFSEKIDIPDILPDPGEDLSKYYTGKQDFSGLVVKVSFGKKF